MNRLIEKLKKIISLFIIHLFNCFPIKNNKIFMTSYYGSQYGCNPKYITEYIIRNMPEDHFDIVWAFNDVIQHKHIPYIRKVKNMSLKYFYELCTSKIVITNFRTTDLFVKRKNQYYIQTWHSSLRLKQIEKDAEDKLPKSYVEMAKKDSKKCDLLLSGCKFSTDIFKRSFWYDGEIYEHGTPRNDFLLNQKVNLKRNVLNLLNIPSDYKIILYAPTFRNHKDHTIYELEFEKIIRTVENTFGGKWICLVKLHPHLLSLSNNIIRGKDVLDVTNYDDIQELLSVSDILISDYSSLMFDFAMTRKPCFLYVPDYEEYTSKDRNLYFNVLELPFKVAMNKEELLHKIIHFESNTYSKDLDQFFFKIGSYEDGKASEYLVRRINNICFGESREIMNEAV
ncbi:CDP-glycerol glycerophosphotransferase family protein [Lederbergia citrisecunda]|uniref:CDP-glycerol glycerophosphotransferase family protein n=1 Tax=Lederbergia citrisecunda TaxID=2833583 RepID=UPI001F416420|nr:CDP-glycerol glycerophosphotransferase family protein [Lederbergia citrisecunda]